MKRGTTPEIVFETDCDCTVFDLLEVTIAQSDEVIITKKISECEREGNLIRVKLTEEETLKLDCNRNPVQLQIRAGKGETRIASDVMLTTVGKILREGCLDESDS